jgi:hypothetical protein
LSTSSKTCNPKVKAEPRADAQGLSANIFAAHSESLRHGAAAVTSGSLSADYPVKEISINWLELLGEQAGRGSGGSVRSSENDKTVSLPSPRPLEDADTTVVSHTPTASATAYIQASEKLKQKYI